MKSSHLLDNEYHPYYHPYISQLGDVELLPELQNTLAKFSTFLTTVPDEKMLYAYATKKWTVAQVLVHIIDAERVFQYRALRFARRDKTNLPGFDENKYVPVSNANLRSKSSILKEFTAVRNSTIALFETFSDEDLIAMGSANGTNMSVRALGFVICGHQLHHQRVIVERYL